MVISMDPVVPLKQLIPVPTKLIANGFNGTKIVKVSVAAHALASKTFTVYVPFVIF